MGKNKTAKRPSVDTSRKAIRKQKRQQKKIHRQEHYMKKKNIVEQPQLPPGRFVKRPVEKDVGENTKLPVKKHKMETYQDIMSREREKTIKQEQKLKREMDEQRRQILLKANEEEDKIIKKLEKQMGLNKSKNKLSYFADDGLDYLLEICDKKTSEKIVAAEKHLANVDDVLDFDEDITATTDKKNKKKDTENASKHKRRRTKSKSEDNLSDLENNDLSGLDTDKELSDVGEESDYEDEELSGDDEKLSHEDEKFGSDNEEFNEKGRESNGINEIASNSDEDNTENDEPGNEIDESDEEPEEQSSKPQKTKVSQTKLASTEQLKKSNKQKSIKNERIISEDDVSKVFSDDEVSHLSDDDDLEDDGDLDEGEIDNETKEQEKPDMWEDIYGRKRDKEGNIIEEKKGTYIPPHLRNKDSTSEKDLAQLNRQIKSVLNKVSGANLHWACASLEAVYAAHSRHAASGALARLWLQAAAGRRAAPERLAAEHAALVAALHANVAAEVGAHFLLELCTRFDAMLREPLSPEDKRLENVVLCLSCLYNFKLYNAPLMYDILERLVSAAASAPAPAAASAPASAPPAEALVACVVVALRTAGAALRREEPLALKGFIQRTQAAAAALQGAGCAPDRSRMKFLLEVLMYVKNNNLTKIPKYDPSYTEELRKALRGVIRRGNVLTPLNIRLEDLLKAEERGKWWIVGSAWQGAGVGAVGAAGAAVGAAGAAVGAAGAAVGAAAGVGADARLLRLAREQRMNTDLRRDIFCVLMGAEDYTDAAERLQRLGLRGPRGREAARVLAACCLQERAHNPYYGWVAKKLCELDRNLQLAIKYTIWDKIKDIENLSKMAAGNLAQFVTTLIVEKALPLSVLKVIRFCELNKRLVGLMRHVLGSLWPGGVGAAPGRDALRLFVEHFLADDGGRRSRALSDAEPGSAAHLVGRLLAEYQTGRGEKRR